MATSRRDGTSIQRQSNLRLDNISNLPVELRLAILSYAPNIATLRALTGCCSAFLDAYRSFRMEILSAVLLREFAEDGPGGLADALAAVWSSQSNQACDGKTLGHSDTSRIRIHRFCGQSHLPCIIKYLGTYREASETGFCDVQQLSLTDSLSLIRLKTAIEFLMKNFLQTVWELPHSSKPFQMSKTEQQRLRRAFFRWQIYCNLFPYGQILESQDFRGNFRLGEYAVESSRLAPHHKEGLFSALFPPWEAEEVRVVQDHYARSVYKKIGSGWIRDLSKSVRDNVLSEVNAASGPASWWAFLRPPELVAFGPLLLYKILLTSDWEKRGSLLSARMSELERPLTAPSVSNPPSNPLSSCLNFFLELVGRLGTQRVNYEQVPFAIKLDETACGPNAAWFSLARANKLPSLWCVPTSVQSRSWGYVIWDWERLKPGGVFDLESLGFDVSTLGLASKHSECHSRCNVWHMNCHEHCGTQRVFPKVLRQ